MGNKKELFEKLVPVLAALMGGLLTALGTFLVQHSTRGVEVREFHREKLETVYILSGEVVTCAEDHIQQMMVVSVVEPDLEILKKRSPIDRVIMTVRLYEPSILDVAKDFEKSMYEFKSKEYKFWMEMSKENFSEASASHEALKVAREKLLDSVKKSIDKYI